MPENAIETGDEFLLSYLPHLLQGFVPPEGPFDPGGAWTHTYKLYCTAFLSYGRGQMPAIGQVRLERAPQPGGGSRLAVEYVKTTGGTQSGEFAGSVKAKLNCGGDALATPLSWEIEQTLPAPFLPFDYRGVLRKSGQRKGNTLEVACNGRTMRIPLPRAYTSNWSLLDAVQRLPRQKGRPLRFTLLEEGELPKPGQALSFRQTVRVELPVATRPAVTLHGFQQLGEGVSPATYWLDEQGRLLFFFSGLDALVLAPAAT